MGEWREGKLADVCESIDYGLTASSSGNPAGPKFLRITDIVGNALTWHNVPYVQASEKDAEKFKINDGDIVIARTGATTGESRFISNPPHAVFASYLVRLRINQENDARFISYWLKSPAFRGYLQGVLGDKSAQPNASAATMTQAPIRIPANPVKQRAIAAVLGALDDKIELNRRMNETLEAMARAIFKDWFVDFGPTRAKAEGRAPYLAPEISDLFPDALDDDKKPVGWKRERIGINVIAKRGLSYKGAGLTDEANGIPLHNLNSVLEGGGYKNDGLKFYSGNYKPRHIVQPGDLIVANTEQGFDLLLIGYSALIPAWVGKEGLFSHHIFKVEPRPASHLSRVWLHYTMSASWFGDAIRRFSNGTTVNMLPQDAFEIPEIVVPPSVLVRAFDEFVGPNLRRQEDAVSESRTLAQTRDLLLPKLMSGEIRLADAEMAVEAVA